MVFNFVSGSHTDSSEKGQVMWARVKGKTENALATLPFKGQYNFRPAYMKPMPGQKNAKLFYKWVGTISMTAHKLLPNGGKTSGNQEI